jgi:hypothetical protein
MIRSLKVASYTINVVILTVLAVQVHTYQIQFKIKTNMYDRRCIFGKSEEIFRKNSK